MNNVTGSKLQFRRRAAATVVTAALFVAACAPTPEVPDGVAEARAELARLQSDAKLATLVPEAIQDAEAALQLAEQADADAEVTAHRIYVAQRKIELARATAEARRAEEERKVLARQRDQAQLAARTRQVEAARMEADVARMDATQARQRTAALESEIAAMHARETERGLLLTLGDVLFETGKADLKPGSIADLDQLAAFLAKYSDRTVTVEGHTDDVGPDDYNVGLSQRRADAVKSYLLRQGVDPARVRSVGMGESVPVVPNDNAGNRQQNRRVEIIVSNPPMG